MPSASPELRRQWPGHDREAILHLQAQGYRLNERWAWVRPTPEHVVTDRDRSAIQYLIDEWDFDGLLSAV
jgi:hypothetical protein